jgi:hypothetical protein
LRTQHMKSFIDRASRFFDGPAEISFCHGTIIGQDDSWLTPPYGR